MNNYTLMTITGETCAGKSYLLDELIARDMVNKIVSCTTRPPRVGEIDGKDYYFLSEEDFQWGLDRGDFAEYIKFNGVYYGTRHNELQSKITELKPGVIILEPNGVNIYEQYCATQAIAMLKVFVMTPEKVRLERLNKRFLKELNSCSDNPEDRFRLIEQFTNRVYSTATEEQKWVTSRRYDLYVSGEYTRASIELIKELIKNYKEV